MSEQTIKPDTIKTDAIQRSLKIAFFCGVTPLVLGAVVYAAWLVTGWIWLITAGVRVFWVGLLLFLVGTVAALSARSKVYKFDVDERGRLPVHVAWALVLLVVNFPVAFMMIGSAVKTGYPTELTVKNQTTAAMSDVSFFWGAFVGDLGTIPAGETASLKCRIPFFHSGFVDIDYRQSDVDMAINISGLVRRKNPKAPMSVTVQADGSVLLSDRGDVEIEIAKVIENDAGVDDKLIFRYRDHRVEFERAVQGKNEWWESDTPLGDDALIKIAQVSIDGDEFRIDGETSTQKFFQRRNLSDGKLIESSVQ